MMNNLRNIYKFPWKAINELKMYLLKPFAFCYINLINRVLTGKGAKYYGLPKILKSSGSQVVIGSNFENRNWWFSNPLGINHPTIICTWSSRAIIKIGDNVGISGGSIVASIKIEIGEGTLIGANTIIIDTDFHPVKSKSRRYDQRNIKSKPVIIGRNVFIGVNCVILKGVRIADNSVIPAGTILR